MYLYMNWNKLKLKWIEMNWNELMWKFTPPLFWGIRQNRIVEGIERIRKNKFFTNSFKKYLFSNLRTLDVSRNLYLIQPNYGYSSILVIPISIKRHKIYFYSYFYLIYLLGLISNINNRYILKKIVRIWGMLKIIFYLIKKMILTFKTLNA